MGEEGRGAFYPFQIFDILAQKGRGVTKRSQMVMSSGGVTEGCQVDLSGWGGWLMRERVGDR